MLIDKVLQETFKKSSKEIKKLVQETGDYGDTAQKLFLEKNQIKTDNNTECLDLKRMDEIINKMNEVVGEDSVNRKAELLSQMIKQCQTDLEIKYIIRMLFSVNKLDHDTIQYIEEKVFGYQIHQRAADKSSQSQMKEINKEASQEEQQQQNNSQKPLIDTTDSEYELKTGRASQDFKESLKLMDKFLEKEGKNKFLAEFKYDGERTQIHFDGEKVTLYSRNFEMQDKKFQLLKNQLQQYLLERKSKGEIDKCILDGEIVCISNKNNTYVPFQKIQRSWKDIMSDEQLTREIEQSNSRPCVILFDILSLNMKNALKMPIIERKKMLEQSFNSENIPNFIQLGQYEIIELPQINEENLKISEDQIERLMALSQQSHCEGLILKIANRNSFYETRGTRSQQWTKIKHKLNSKITGMRDSLDLVPIGASFGLGLRTGILGSFIMAAYSKKYKNFEVICKLGTGLSQNEMKSFTTQFLEIKLDRQPQIYVAPKTIRPDIWIPPKFVWEIGCDQFSQSSTFTIGRGKLPSLMMEENNQNEVEAQSKGLSIRFPRFLRERDDKKVTSNILSGSSINAGEVVYDSDCTSVEEIIEMYMMDYEYNKQKLKELTQN
ncbi:dna ligase [Stylonychia lemnae]|uniref:DNA ligase (ATP) n=1 Tax=Stylonychia lemnae TaxID=5949 RepID=A0A078ATL0_STYLE|nr:dna ligase [Stylonychia lemnae]|eukprot:CDW85574.1 dna ligase [Stylonychia lemnae]